MTLDWALKKSHSVKLKGVLFQMRYPAFGKSITKCFRTKRLNRGAILQIVQLGFKLKNGSFTDKIICIFKDFSITYITDVRLCLTGKITHCSIPRGWEEIFVSIQFSGRLHRFGHVQPLAADAPLNSADLSALPGCLSTLSVRGLKGSQVVNTRRQLQENRGRNTSVHDFINAII